MQAPGGPSRSSSFASESTGTDPQYAALLGATTAFGRPVPKVKPGDGGQGGANSVRSHATNTVQRRQPSPSLPQLNTGEGVRNGKSIAGVHAAPSMGSSPMSHLGLPQHPDREQSKSPSLQAAALAAARAPRTNALPAASQKPEAKTTRRPAAPPKPRQLSSNSVQTVSSQGSDGPTDATSIPPTTSLVDLFERKASMSDPAKKRPGPIVVKPGNDLALKSPKPVRTSGGITTMIQLGLDNGQKLTEVPSNESSNETALEKPQLSRMLSSTSSYISAAEEQPAKEQSTNQQPSADNVRLNFPPALPTRQQNPPAPVRSTTNAAVDIPSRIDTKVLDRSETLSPSSASAKSIPAQFHQIYPARRMTPNMTGDQLANAMVAGSLASSRAGSPHKSETPRPPSRRPKHKSTLGFSRTPSPAKTGMRHTLRKEESSSSDSSEDESLHPYGKHRKKRHLRKHPNKHHEGDRKRWRDAVTEAERKRYEGLWAANKGLLIGFLAHEEAEFMRSPESQETKETKLAAREEVSNIVVRELWNRSRLPAPVLSEIWQLVDNRGVGRLTKEEFVVGVWLIDQRLKGRKLPPKVSDTVWASVKGLQGIKIKK